MIVAFLWDASRLQRIHAEDVLEFYHFNNDAYQKFVLKEYFLSGITRLKLHMNDRKHRKGRSKALSDGLTRHWVNGIWNHWGPFLRMANISWDGYMSLMPLKRTLNRYVLTRLWTCIQSQSSIRKINCTVILNTKLLNYELKHIYINILQIPY